MNNSQIAKIFDDIADLLELKGDNIFKIRAYRRVVHSIENLPEEVESLVSLNRLDSISGAGEAIRKKIVELVTTGKLDYYEKLKTEFPEGISVLLDIPGIGPKTALLLSKELGIKNVNELEDALLKGTVSSLPRMGDKVSYSILRHIQSMRRKEQRIPIGQALPIVNQLIAQLRQLPGINNFTAAGSLRRFKETVGDIDIMGAADDAVSIIDEFIKFPQVKEVLAHGDTKASVVVVGDLQVDLRIVAHEYYGSLLQHFTGSQQHNVLLRERARRDGLSLSEYGITTIDTNKTERFVKEEDFYSRLGLQYIPPELREGTEEISLASQNSLPRLLELSDIQGDLHIHSNWSDGLNSIDEIAFEAANLGYKYIAITDHSVGRAIAHGLDSERLKQQADEIHEANKRIAGTKILKGIEVDIKANGELDLPDVILEKCDIVIAAVHSSLRQNREQMTRRIISAMENPNVDIIAHPTCRLLPDREAISIDMDEIYKSALRTNTMLEINAMPSRLDLKDTHIFKAREMGVKLIINTDSHSTDQLRLMYFGVGTSRRGWCQASDIVNTQSLPELLSSIKS